MKQRQRGKWSQQRVSHIHIDTQRLEQLIDQQQQHQQQAQAAASQAAPHASSYAPNGNGAALSVQPTLFPRKQVPLSSNGNDTDAAASSSPAASNTESASTNSSSYLRSVLSSLYSSSAFYFTSSSASKSSAPHLSSGLEVTEPPLSPRSEAVATSVAFPFTRAPAVYSVPFIINDQLCIVPYVPLPLPPSASSSLRPASSSGIAHSASSSSFSPHSPTPCSSPRSPYSPPSPPSPSLSSFYSPAAVELGHVWLSLLSPHSLFSRFHPNLYPKLLHTPSAFSSHITKDISRTFPSLPLFQQRKVKQMLYNVLKAYSNYDMDIGYSQGMAFLAACLLMTSQDEQSVFWAFVSLMYRPQLSLRSLYFDDCVSLKRLLTLVQRTLDSAAHLAPLSQHLRSLHLDVTLFTTQWLVTVYSYRFSPPFTQRVWSDFLVHGWPVLLQVAVGVLGWLQPRVVGLSFEQTMPVVTSLYEVGVEVVDECLRTVQIDAATVRELDSCKQSDKRVRALKM